MQPSVSVKACSSYGPWIRDYNFSINKVDEEHNPAVFTADWFYGMWLRLFFSVDGPASNYATKGPLTVPSISAIGFAVASTVLVLAYIKRIFQTYDSAVLSLMAVVTVLYVSVLWLDEFRAFLHTGQPVAINGRYLLPVLPFLLLVGALAINEFCGRRAELKLALASVAALSLLWGGGALTYILRSEDSWYWPSPAVRSANHAVQRTLGPVTPGYHKPEQFLH